MRIDVHAHYWTDEYLDMITALGKTDTAAQRGSGAGGGADLHPSGNAACSALISGYHGTWMVGAPVEDTISAFHLIIRGIPARFPGMRILNSHLGGALPMLLQRMDNQYRWEAPDTPEPPSVSARRMWYDTVGHGHAPALRCAAESFGASQLVLGTDFPYESGPVFRRAVDYVTTSGLAPADAEGVLGANAITLFGPGAFPEVRQPSAR